MDAKKKKKQIRPSGFPVPVARMYQQGPETNYNSHISPTWKCKRENCNGVLTLLGNVKKHIHESYLATSMYIFVFVWAFKMTVLQYDSYSIIIDIIVLIFKYNIANKNYLVL